jgi:hypothetical protein
VPGAGKPGLLLSGSRHILEVGFNTAATSDARNKKCISGKNFRKKLFYAFRVKEHIIFSLIAYKYSKYLTFTIRINSVL